MDRCEWAANELMIAYHDEEWGVPLHDDRLLFEFLILEGAQAGLSWNTILNKRENYRSAFDNFDATAISRYGDAKVRSLLADAAGDEHGALGGQRRHSAGFHGADGGDELQAGPAAGLP